MKKAKSQGDIPSGSSIDPVVTYTGFSGTKDAKVCELTMELSKFRLAFTKHLTGPKDGTALGRCRRAVYKG